MRRVLGVTCLIVASCGGAPAAPRPAVGPLASAHIAVTEPSGLQVTGRTIGVTGRATPFGISGGEPVAWLRGPTLDPSYAYTPENPARVGGFHDRENPESGQSAYLNALYGPQGQPLYYERIGSVHGPDGILDAFAVEYEGLGDRPIVLYLDPYHLETLWVPVGLRTSGASEPEG